MTLTTTVIIREFGLVSYQPVWASMKTFTDQRSENTPDELWLLEHFPIYTLGQNADEKHILRRNEMPIFRTDRGGQVTYHGPGQLIIYTLVDLKRKHFTIRDLITRLEQAVINFLIMQNITAVADRNAPGVYVNDEKICSLGLRIRRGCSYHGLAFNVNMDLSPFKNINPCGFSTLAVTQLSSFQPQVNMKATNRHLCEHLMASLDYTNPQWLYKLSPNTEPLHGYSSP